MSSSTLLASFTPINNKLNLEDNDYNNLVSYFHVYLKPNFNINKKEEIVEKERVNGDIKLVLSLIKGNISILINKISCDIDIVIKSLLILFIILYKLKSKLILNPLDLEIYISKYISLCYVHKYYELSRKCSNIFLKSFIMNEDKNNSIEFSDFIDNSNNFIYKNINIILYNNIRNDLNEKESSLLVSTLTYICNSCIELKVYFKELLLLVKSCKQYFKPNHCDMFGKIIYNIGNNANDPSIKLTSLQYLLESPNYDFNLVTTILQSSIAPNIDITLLTDTIKLLESKLTVNNIYENLTWIRYFYASKLNKKIISELSMKIIKLSTNPELINLYFEFYFADKESTLLYSLQSLYSIIISPISNFVNKPEKLYYEFSLLLEIQSKAFNEKVYMKEKFLLFSAYLSIFTSKPRLELYLLTFKELSLSHICNLFNPIKNFHLITSLKGSLSHDKFNTLQFIFILLRGLTFLSKINSCESIISNLFHMCSQVYSSSNNSLAAEFGFSQLESLSLMVLSNNFDDIVWNTTELLNCMWKVSGKDYQRIIGHLQRCYYYTSFVKSRDENISDDGPIIKSIYCYLSLLKLGDEALSLDKLMERFSELNFKEDLIESKLIPSCLTGLANRKLCAHYVLNFLNGCNDDTFCGYSMNILTEYQNKFTNYMDSNLKISAFIYLIEDIFLNRKSNVPYKPSNEQMLSFLICSCLSNIEAATVYTSFSIVFKNYSKLIPTDMFDLSLNFFKSSLTKEKTKLESEHIKYISNYMANFSLSNILTIFCNFSIRFNGDIALIHKILIFLANYEGQFDSFSLYYIASIFGDLNLSYSLLKHAYIFEPLSFKLNLEKSQLESILNISSVSSEIVSNYLSEIDKPSLKSKLLLDLKFKSSLYLNSIESWAEYISLHESQGSLYSNENLLQAYFSLSILYSKKNELFLSLQFAIKSYDFLLSSTLQVIKCKTPLQTSKTLLTAFWNNECKHSSKRIFLGTSLLSQLASCYHSIGDISMAEYYIKLQIYHPSNLQAYIELHKSFYSQSALSLKLIPVSAEDLIAKLNLCYVYYLNNDFNAAYNIINDIEKINLSNSMLSLTVKKSKKSPPNYVDLSLIFLKAFFKFVEELQKCNSESLDEYISFLTSTNPAVKFSSSVLDIESDSQLLVEWSNKCSALLSSLTFLDCWDKPLQSSWKSIYLIFLDLNERLSIFNEMINQNSWSTNIDQPKTTIKKKLSTSFNFMNRPSYSVFNSTPISHFLPFQLANYCKLIVESIGMKDPMLCSFFINASVCFSSQFESNYYHYKKNNGLLPEVNVNNTLETEYELFCKNMQLLPEKITVVTITLSVNKNYLIVSRIVKDSAPLILRLSLKLQKTSTKISEKPPIIFPIVESKITTKKTTKVTKKVVLDIKLDEIIDLTEDLNLEVITEPSRSKRIKAVAVPRATRSTRAATMQVEMVRDEVNDVDGISFNEDVGSLSSDKNHFFVLMNKYRILMKNSHDSTHSASVKDVYSEDFKKSFWSTRKNLDSELATIMCEIEQNWFGVWKDLLLGISACKLPVATLDKVYNDLIKVVHMASKDFIFPYLELLIQSSCDKSDIIGGLCWLLNVTNIEILEKCFSILNSHKISSTSTVERSHLVLILSKELLQVPFEGLPTIIENKQSVYRLFSIHFLWAHLLNSKYSEKGIKAANTFYVLNPSQNLEKTEKTFDPIFKIDYKWSGITGVPPTKTDMVKALSSSDIFVYCGHNGGEKYLRNEDLKSSNVNAAALLVGCSSGCVSYNGDYDVHGTALSYLEAGCPLFLGNLWDVTDGDIDRFLISLLKHWIPNKTNVSLSLGQSIIKARDSCVLKYLTGLAPVIYGYPPMD